jgi:hypothetical protein
MDDFLKGEKLALAIAAQTSGKKLCIVGRDLELRME